MKRLLFVLLLAGPLTGCHAPVTITTPQGHAAYTADQVVVRVNELQNAAIAANAATPPALSTTTTRVIVQFAVATDTTLAQVPAGWQATVRTAWATAKAQLTGITNPLITALMAAVDAVLGGI